MLKEMLTDSALVGHFLEFIETGLSSNRLYSVKLGLKMIL